MISSLSDRANIWLRQALNSIELGLAVVSTTVIELIIVVFKAVIRALNIRIVEIGPSQ